MANIKRGTNIRMVGILDSNEFKNSLAGLVSASDSWLDHRGHWRPHEYEGETPQEERSRTLFTATDKIANRSHSSLGTLQKLVENKILQPIPWVCRCLLEAYTDMSLVGLDETEENAARYLAWDDVAHAKAGSITQGVDVAELRLKYPDIDNWRSWAKSRDGRVLNKDRKKLNYANQLQQKRRNPYLSPEFIELLQDIEPLVTTRSHVRLNDLAVYMTGQDFMFAMFMPSIQVATLHTYLKSTDSLYKERFSDAECWSAIADAHQTFAKVISDFLSNQGA